MNPKRSLIAPCVSLIALLLLSGCASEMAYRDGKDMLTQGRIEEGLAKLDQAAREDPANLEYRTEYLNARQGVVSSLLARARREQAAGRLDEAESLYRQVLKFDPDGNRALEGLAAVDRLRHAAELIGNAKASLIANNLEEADRQVSRILLDDPGHAEAKRLRRQIDELGNRDRMVSPTLRKSFRKPVSMEFRDAGLKQVLEALSRHSGLQFTLDKDVPANLTTTIFLREVSVQDALDVILGTHQLAKRILNDTTLLIYPNTAAKQSENQELILKSFYLSNADAKQVMEMLKSVLKAKNVYMDEKLNLVFMRDTPAAVRLAERLVAMQDVPEPEVMLEVEILEVKRSRLTQLGIQLPDQLTLAPLPSTGTQLTLKDLQNVNASTLGATIPNLVVNLHKDVGETNILANPRIRTRNHEKAEIKIGDRVPIITTTTTSTGFVSENVQYVDVGLKLNVEPAISPDNDVSIRVSLEVSSVVNQIVSKAGTISYQIGTRNASTVLRLKDGETQILGGLINDQDLRTANKVPGLGDLPILGRLFSSHKDDKQKTELILSITPHIVQGIAPPPHVPTEFWSGTENNLGLKPLIVASLAAPHAAVPEVHSGKSSSTIPGASAETSSESTLAASPAKPPQLRWEGTSRVKAGATFTLSLKASSDREIVGFPVQVKYDPSVLEMVDAASGDFMGQGGGKVDFGKRIVANTGIAFLTQNRATGGAKGDGELLQFSFKALKPAESTVVSALPAIPMGPVNRPMSQTGPAMTGIAVTP
jgi:general secretion pathway protein D